MKTSKDNFLKQYGLQKQNNFYELLSVREIKIGWF